MFGLGIVCFGGAVFMAVPHGTQTIRVTGNTACPTTGEVDAALVGMVPLPPPSAAPDVVELLAREGAVAIRLSNAAGERIAEKWLPGARSCGERARMAAVMVAAWEARLHGGAQPVLPAAQATATSTGPRSWPAAAVPPAFSAARPPGTKVIAPAPPAPSAAPAPQSPRRPPSPPRTLSEGAAPATAPAPAPAAVSAAALPPPPSVPPESPPNVAALVDRDAPAIRAAITAPEPLAVETGAAVLTSLVAGEIAMGGAIEARFSRRNAALALGVGALAVDSHVLSVTPGQGRWRRFGGILDLRALARWGPVEMEMRAGVVLCALAVSGRQFPVTSGATLFDGGALAGLRSRLSLGRLRPWIDATAVAWPNQHGLYVTGTSSSADIPTFEVWFAVGASLELIR